MNWPNDFDGAHQVADDKKNKQFIYESPDKGKTIYRREFHSLERTLVSKPEEPTSKPAEG